MLISVLTRRRKRCVIFLVKRKISANPYSLHKKLNKTRNVFKKDKRRRIKKGKKKYNTMLSTCTYTDDWKLRMIIVKYQRTAILANFVRKWVMSSNSIKKIYYLCNDRQRQKKLANVDNNKYNVFVFFKMLQVLI